MVIQLTSDIRDEKELKKIQEKFGKLYSKGKRILQFRRDLMYNP